MFDIGIGEVGLIAIVALLVLGPERLPKVARTSGALLRKARQSWQNIRDEIEREFAAEELKRNLKETVRTADPRPAVNDVINATMQDIHASTHPSITTATAVSPSANKVIPTTPNHDERV